MTRWAQRARPIYNHRVEPGRRHRPVFAPLLWLALGVSCAQIVGLTGDYEVANDSRNGGGTGGASGGAAGGDRGGEGGAPTGGGTMGGSAGESTGGSAGESGGGTAGDVTGGAAGDGIGGTAGDAGNSGAGAGGAGAGGAGAGGTSGTGGTGPTHPSCEGLLPSCGPNNDTDCCASIAVDGGDFNRINDEAYPATVSSFRLDTYEVTVARFRKFEADFAANWRPTVGEGNNPDDETDDGWESSFTAALPADRDALRSMLACHYHATWTNDPQGNEERPINCVDWYTAFAFCIWDDGRLPTEAEWNFAAAGGDEQRVYPWSDPASSTLIEVRHASFNSLGELECGGDYTVGCAVTDLVEVGTRVDGYGFFGHAELAGNVYEWTRDRYEPTLPTPCVDCANLSEGPRHVVRGACYNNIGPLLRTTFRLDDGWINDEPSSGIGIRCARDRGP